MLRSRVRELEFSEDYSLNFSLLANYDGQDRVKHGFFVRMESSPVYGSVLNYRGGG